MVCAESGKVERIAGGFVLVDVPALMTAWRACRTRPLKPADFRTWLAAHEMAARRCHVHHDRERSPSYGIAELAKLLGVTERRARASVRRLVAAGLIEWSSEAIVFPEPAEVVDDLDAIGAGKGSLAIPRRMLRYLIAGARPILIATVLGLLLRCLSRRKGGWDGRGRAKASWIANLFGVDHRRVKQARKELVALGWIRAEGSGQRAENRWGRAYRVDLTWDRVGAGGRNLPPLPADDRREIATPSVDQEPSLTGGLKNQEPAGGSAGSSKGRSGEGRRPLPDPTLDDVKLEDLKDTGRLLDLHRQAVERKLVTTAEADRLRFVGAAEHALAIASNPVALFAWIVLNVSWRYITGADEDRARRRLREHLHGEHPRGGRGVPTFSPGESVETLQDFAPPGRSPFCAPFGSMAGVSGLSEDARIVREVRAACIRAGIYRDPWPAFSAKYPAWDRARWDRAMVELGLA